MDNNNCDNSFELYARHHAQRDTPASDDVRVGGDVTDTSNQSHNDEFNPQATISIISDPHRGGRTVTPPTTTATNQPRAPSIKFKLTRKRSSAGSDATDHSDASVKATNNRVKSRSELTSSFLRRKRVEYAGTIKYDLFFEEFFNIFCSCYLKYCYVYNVHSNESKKKSELTKSLDVNSDICLSITYLSNTHCVIIF